MAEAYLQQLSEGTISVESAGLHPKPILPLVVEVMKEEGIDLSNKTSKNVFDLFKKGKLYDVVITVCDESIENQCPIFPGITKRLHWAFPDPQSISGNREEQLAELRKLRNSIKERIIQWLSEFK